MILTCEGTLTKEFPTDSLLANSLLGPIETESAFSNVLLTLSSQPERPFFF